MNSSAPYCKRGGGVVTTRFFATAVIFSIFVFLAFLPLRWSMTGKLKFLPVFLGVTFGSQFVQVPRFLLTTFTGKVLFLFPAQALPQRYTYALVPLACLVALLYLAERLSARFEI